MMENTYVEIVKMSTNEIVKKHGPYTRRVALNIVKHTFLYSVFDTDKFIICISS